MSNEKSASGPDCCFRLEISGGFLLLVSFTGFLWGAESLFSAAMAAAFHELGHLSILLLQGNLPSRLRLDFSGACLRCAGRAPTCREELLRAMAGPAAGFLLWAAAVCAAPSFFRETGNMSLMLSLVNLLPVEGLDGGRVLRCLLSRSEPGMAEKALAVLNWLSAALVLILGILHSPQLFLYGLWLVLRAARIFGID